VINRIILLPFIGLAFLSCTSDSKNDKSKTSAITLNEYNIEQLNQINDTPTFSHKKTNQAVDGKIFQVLENDKKVYLGRLINGKPDGLWIKRSKNGNKIEEGNYSNGLLEDILLYTTLMV